MTILMRGIVNLSSWWNGPRRSRQRSTSQLLRPSNLRESSYTKHWTAREYHRRLRQLLRAYCPRSHLKKMKPARNQRIAWELKSQCSNRLGLLTRERADNVAHRKRECRTVIPGHGESLPG